MSRSTHIACGALLLAVSLGEVNLAQDLNLYDAPGGAIPGNAGVELSAQRRQDIGTGYSAANLNRQALNSASIRTPGVGGFTSQTVVGGVNNNIAGGGVAALRPAASFGVGPANTGTKPFAGVSTRPTVSPYINLFREDLDGFSDFNYQTLVRPQLQQQEINQDLQRRQQELNANVQALVAQPAFNPQGSQSQYPTGHATFFRNLSHYYPLAGQPRRAKQ